MLQGTFSRDFIKANDWVVTEEGLSYEVLAVEYGDPEKLNVVRLTITRWEDGSRSAKVVPVEVAKRVFIRGYVVDVSPEW